MKVCLFEDNKYVNFLPLVYFRPVWELICGAGSIKEGIEKNLSEPIKYFYLERDYISGSRDLDGEFLFINGRLLPNKFLSKILNEPHELFVSQGEIVAFRGTKEEFDEVKKDPTKKPHREVKLKLIQYPWDLLNNLGEQIGVTKVQEGAIVSSNVVIDDSKGPVYIGRGTIVHPFTLLRGPLYIGENCRIAGEVSSSIIMSHTNKAHYGFIGDSYICSWVNLGAGTTNSNLKNNYGTVKVGGVDTGRQFVGCFIADHTAVAIGTMIYTGCVIGVSANVFGSHYVSKEVSSFSWGESGIAEIEKVKAAAKAMMARRSVEFSPSYGRLLEKIYEITQKES